MGHLYEYKKVKIITIIICSISLVIVYVVKTCNPEQIFSTKISCINSYLNPGLGFFHSIYDCRGAFLIILNTIAAFDTHLEKEEPLRGWFSFLAIRWLSAVV